MKRMLDHMDLPADAVWRMYRGRADCENRIKKLKYDFAADSLNMQDFWAIEAALNTVMLAYNLMSQFRQVLLKTMVVRKGVSEPIQHTLQTLRYKLFAKPAYTPIQGAKTHIESGDGYAKKAVDAGPVGSSKAVRFARQIRGKSPAVKSEWKIWVKGTN